MTGSEDDRPDEGLPFATTGSVADESSPLPLAPTVVDTSGGRNAQPVMTGANLARGAVVGRYVVLDRIGAGGMGVVYRAYDPDLDRRVALKLLQVSGERNGALHARLLREGQALAKVSHPNVVSIYDVGDIRDEVFIAMELIEGQTLRQWLAESKPTFQVIVETFLAAGDGLAAAHRASLVHRDFKPENVIVDAAGQPHVLDFGIARASDDTSLASLDAEVGAFKSVSQLDTPLTRAGDRLGTPLYMAPEQHAGRAVDHRADQYAFGVALWEAVYGVVPFAATTYRELVEKLEKGQPDEPPVRAGVRLWFRRMLERAIRREPSDRYPSMDALLSEMRERMRRDRSRPTRRVISVTGIALASAAIAAKVAYRPEKTASAAPSCEEDPRALAGVWDDDVKRDVRRALVVINASSAEYAFNRFASALDEYLDKWRQVRHDVCIKSEIRHEQPHQQYLAQVHCLQNRLSAVATLTGVLKHASADDVRQAAGAPGRLPSVDECAGSATELPADALRGVTAEYERRTYDAVGEYAAGHLKGSLDKFRAIRESAAKEGFADPAILSVVELMRGRAAADLGEPDAREAFEQAFTMAVRRSDWTLMAESAQRVAQEFLFAHKLEEMHTWLGVGRAAATRVYGSDGLIEFMDQLDCMAHYWTGKERTRLQCMRDLAARVRKRGFALSEWQLTVLGIAASEAGEDAEALDYLRESLKLTEKSFGPRHTETLLTRAYLAQGYLRIGDYAAAEREAADAMRVAGDDADTKVAKARLALYRGEALLSLHREAEAAPLIKLAVADPDTRIEAITDEVYLRDRARPRERIEAARKAFEDTKKDFPATHPQTVTAVLDLARACLDAKDTRCAAEAIATLDAGLDESEMDPKLVAHVDQVRGEVLLGNASKRADAIRFLQRADARLRALKWRSPWTQELLDTIAKQLAQLGATK